MRASEEHQDTAYHLVRALLADRGADDSIVASEAIEQMVLQWHETNSLLRWSRLAAEAEHHGVAPLIEPMITGLSRKRPEVIPDDVRRVFVALTSRHRRAAAIREKCIDQLLAAFATVGIPIILLKGAALAHRAYRSPELRPMVDVDMLIEPADTERAVTVIRGLGYFFAPRHQSRFAGHMHHLPPATTHQFGFPVTVELHHEAMSPNSSDSLTFATLAAKPQAFRRGGGPDGVAFGHADMLRHLARHAFEPARRIRLLHLFDLWRYQSLFGEEIDWRELELRFPYVIVALRLVSFVFARRYQPASSAQAKPDPIPAGLGLGMMPLSEIANADIGLFSKLAALFNPPAWWMHGFYGVPPDRSLLTCRALRHPKTLARWMGQRFLAVIGPSHSAPSGIADWSADHLAGVNG